jgi:PAS domain S-box-containing protein
MWFDASIYPSEEGLTVFLREVTEEKRAQEEVTWTKNNLEALINNTEDQIWSVDSLTRYVYMNKAYRRQIAHLTGSEPKKGSYSYHHPGYAPEMIEKWNQHYARALAGERYTIIAESIDPQTHKLLSFEISFNPIYKVKGDITGVGCFARNITALLETEKAIIDQNERLRHIASLTSHELRRPVASMLGLINIIDRVNFLNPDNKEIIEHLLTVGKEIDEVIRLIVDKTFTGSEAKDKYEAP